jgi:hypothetical protein
MTVNDVSWPGPGGAVIITGVVDHGNWRGNGELAVVGGDGQTKAPVARICPAFPAPAFRPGQLRPCPQRPGFVTLYAWGVDRTVPCVGDAVVRIATT